MSRNSAAVNPKRDIMSQKRDSQAIAMRISFGERVRSRIEGMELPDAFFARQAGIPTSTFARYKSGESIPKSDHIFPLADALQVSPRWLLYGEVGDTPLLGDARNAAWVQLPRYRLDSLVDSGKGEQIDLVPYRKDWLNRRLGTSVNLWITELPSDYEALALQEGDAIICADIDAAGPQEKWICVFRGAAGPFVARYSNRGETSELDLPGAIFVTAADLRQGEIYPIARVRARMLARV